MSFSRICTRFSSRKFSISIRHPSINNSKHLRILSEQSLVQERGYSHISRCSSILNKRFTVTHNEVVGNRFYAKKKDKSKGGKKGSSKKLTLSNEELSDLINYDKMIEQMTEVTDHLKHEYIKQLSLRSNIGSFEHLTVETDDGKFPLNQIAQMVQKSPSLIAINCAAMSQYLPAVKSALDKSGMNINPQIDKNTIFVPLPKVTREHRETLAKAAKTLSDRSKDKLKEIHNKYQRDAKKNSDASEDLVRGVIDTIHDKLHEYQTSCDDLMKKKQEELLSK